MVEKLQLVFCGHTRGQLANGEEVQPQPPLGLLILAAFLKRAIPELDVEVLDGRYFSEMELLGKLDAPVVGLSVWFSNYETSCSLASRLKQSRPETTVIMGGPHPTWIGNRILSRQPAVDFVIRGEGEIALARLMKGQAPEKIPGVLFRHGKPEIRPERNSSWGEQVDLDSLPIFDLTMLRPAYKWRSRPHGPAMTAFPVSGIRGCPRSERRCEYCSIPTRGYRFMSVENYWRQIELLYHTYGIDYLFETGDTLSPPFLQRLAAARPNLPVRFRVYSYPGTNGEDDLRYLQQMGITTLFMGVESVLHWQGHSRRWYPSDYTITSLLAEIRRYAAGGIQVWPGFLLGLPGENCKSLRRNLTLIEYVSQLPNVSELTVSIVMPLPGSHLFRLACSNPRIRQAYAKQGNDDLLYTDRIDYSLLTTLFVESYTEIGYDALLESVLHLETTLKPRMATWGGYTPVEPFTVHAPT